MSRASLVSSAGKPVRVHLLPAWVHAYWDTDQAMEHLKLSISSKATHRGQGIQAGKRIVRIECRKLTYYVPLPYWSTYKITNHFIQNSSFRFLWIIITALLTMTGNATFNLSAPRVLVSLNKHCATVSGCHCVFTEMSEWVNGCQFTLNSQKFRAQCFWR